MKRPFIYLMVILVISVCLCSASQAASPVCSRAKVAYMNQLYRQAYAKAVLRAKLAKVRQSVCKSGVCKHR